MVTTPVLNGAAAGDDDTYTFALVRRLQDRLDPTEFTLNLPRVSDILSTVLGKPAGAMAHWGYNLAIDGMRDLAHVADVTELEVDAIKERLKEGGYSPNKVRDDAGSRGNNSHTGLHLLAQGYVPQLAEADGDTIAFLATEVGSDGERTFTGDYVTVLDDGYVRGVIAWWDDMMTGWSVVAAEVPVWSFRVGFCGTLDLARVQDDTGFLEIVDLKTHKPATQAFPAYNHDVFQLRFYRIGWEEVPHTQGIPGGNRTLVVDAKGRFFTDTREVSAQAAEALVPVYYGLRAFEEAKHGSD
jgi:PD-(D/E)XK nuclease superfamily